MTTVHRSDPVRAVHPIFTGRAQQHPEHRFGSKKPLMWWVLTSREWVDCPIQAFAIEHEEGLVLFDTGLDPAIVSDPTYIDSALGRVLLRRIFRLNVAPEDGLASRLARLGYATGDVRYAVISHLHFDHVGGIGAIPQADLLVSRTEWNALSEPHPEREWILREHIELPSARWRPIELEPTSDPLLRDFGGQYDVMGDGSLILLSTPGHTAGSLSMLLRSANLPPMLFVGDLAYDLDGLLADRLPGIGDERQLRDSYSKVRALKEQLPDLLVLPAHDPGAGQALRLASRSPSPKRPERSHPGAEQRHLASAWVETETP